MSETKLFWHIGLPKTASTFLQRKVFPYFDGIHYVKKHDFNKYNRIIEENPEETILFSREMHIGNNRGEKAIVEYAKQHPDTQIIIFFRKHQHWVKSRYKYYIRKHGEKTFKEFVDVDDNQGVIDLNEFHYFPKIQFIEKHFIKKPLVYFQDDLKDQPFTLIDQLATDLGASYNKNDIKISVVKKAYSDKQLKAVREYNKVVQFTSPKTTNKFIRWWKIKPVQFLLHLTAFAASFMPEKTFSKKPLIPSQELLKFDQVFQEDWKKVVEYAHNQKSLS
jgi:hypothetical protein